MADDNYTSAIWYAYLASLPTLGVGFPKHYFSGTVVSSIGKNKIKVKLLNGTEVTAEGYSPVHIPNSYVLMIANYRSEHSSNYSTSGRNYVISGYQIIAVKYNKESGTLSKTYRV